MLDTIISDLKNVSDANKAKILSGFFKTGKGQYGEGDVFIGVTVPNQRKIVKRHYKIIALNDVEKLLQSKIHEHRLTAVLILVEKYEKTKDPQEKESIVQLYKSNFKYINNWDLVDLSAPKILGAYLYDKDRSELYDYAKSKHLWTQRIAILSTFYFIKNKQFDDIIAISEMLINHKHDLIHKAVGWMLREMGKRELEPLLNFLDKHHKTMPRTMLRYSLEKLSTEQRTHYMKKD